MSDEFSFFDAARKARGTVIECTREHFHYSLNVLPPLYGSGFFGVSEPYSHEIVNGREQSTHHWFKQEGNRYFCTFGLKSDAVAAFNRPLPVLVLQATVNQAIANGSPVITEQKP